VKIRHKKRHEPGVAPARPGRKESAARVLTRQDTGKARKLYVPRVVSAGREPMVKTRNMLIANGLAGIARVFHVLLAF
jgi:hypothetical protein